LKKTNLLSKLIVYILQFPALQYKDVSMKRALLVLPVFLSTVHPVFAIGLNGQSGWQHHVEIYALALNIRGDSEVRDKSLDIDVDPKFLMDHIDMGAMLRLEGIYNDQWGYYIDYSFMKLSGTTNNLLSGTDNLILTSDIELRQGIFEAKGFKRYQYEFGYIDYMAGIRWWDNDIDTQFHRKDNQELFDELSFEDDWVDYLVGVRWINPITSNWTFHISADAGLGSDTSFTSAILTGFRYQINSWSDVNLAYKSIWVDYDNDENFAYNTASQGFLVGLGLYF